MRWLNLLAEAGSRLRDAHRRLHWQSRYPQLATPDRLPARPQALPAKDPGVPSVWRHCVECGERQDSGLTERERQQAMRDPANPALPPSSTPHSAPYPVWLCRKCLLLEDKPQP